MDSVGLDWFEDFPFQLKDYLDNKFKNDWTVKNKWTDGFAKDNFANLKGERCSEKDPNYLG